MFDVLFRRLFVLILALIIVNFLTGPRTFAVESANSSPQTELYIMGPLERITDWTEFERRLTLLKKAGATAITTDLWWGMIEPVEGQPRWSYYRKYADVVRKSGLKWIPIFSFHSAGGNVGDNVSEPLPNWIWNKFPDMKYVDNRGFQNSEYISVLTPEAYPLYERVVRSFTENFADYSDMIHKIYIGMGPAGEVRFPSYPQYAGWQYPEIGFLQASSQRAQEDFRSSMRKKYGDIARLNAAWGLKFSSFDDEAIRTPQDGDNFFKGGGFNTPYGRDFLEWYQGLLEHHVTRKLALMNSILRSGATNPFKNIPIGVKLAGIHWLMNHPAFPHAAEYAAGYVDYTRLIKAIHDGGAQLTFTALEMNNGGGPPEYNLPHDLVMQIYEIARKIGVPFNAENALPFDEWGNGDRNVSEFIKTQRPPPKSFTVLRMGALFDEQGNLVTDRITKTLGVIKRPPGKCSTIFTP